MLHGVLHLLGWTMKTITAKWRAPNADGALRSALPPALIAAGGRMIWLCLAVAVALMALLLLRLLCAASLSRIAAAHTPRVAGARILSRDAREKFGLDAEQGALAFSLIKHYRCV